MEAAVIIPAYNPDEELVSLTEQLWERCYRIIVVDDGSEEACQPIFDQISRIHQAVVVHHEENLGKGCAIKTALDFIRRESLPCSVIGIMDADGQHTPEDMTRLLWHAEKKPDELFLGVRKVGEDMPLRSRMGNQITRSIFRKLSGVAVSDTQTGLRAFSRSLADTLLTIPGERYEYEMNMLMYCARHDIPIGEVPIQTIYRDEENSTSHFRTVADSFRIYRDLFKFTLSSMSSFVLDYVLFLILTAFFFKTARMLVLANVLARLISAAYNYYMNTRYVFHQKAGWKSAAQYAGLAGIILVLNSAVLSFLCFFTPLPEALAKMVTECILFLISWVIQHRIIFRKKRMKKKITAFSYAEAVPYARHQDVQSGC